MPGFLVDEPITPNCLEREKQRYLATGRRLIDLTESNPASSGLSFPAEILQSSAVEYLRSRRYQPHPRGLSTAREAIAALLAARTPTWQVSPEQIFITASTSEAYRLLFSLLCDPGDNILTPQVTYPLFDLLAIDSRIGCLSYQLHESADWMLDLQSLQESRNNRSRAVMIVSPHNPTGAVLRQREIELAQLGLPIIADQVFSEFVWDGRGCPALGALYPDCPVFQLDGISKMLALPDLKLGWIALNDAAYRQFGERLEILNDLFLSANQLTQSMLPALLNRREPFLLSLREHYRQNTEAALGLLQNSDSISVTRPQGGNFLFPRINLELDEDEFMLGLLERGVYTHPGYFYGCNKGIHCLISCVPQQEEILDGIEILAEYVKGYGGGKV